jgi:hypothetical protein
VKGKNHFFIIQQKKGERMEEREFFCDIEMGGEGRKTRMIFFKK